ncbi:GTP-binding protein [Ahniella affigens]|uniref:GTP-binding protein n=1 Tax=Ahniella affigens TaxID=2021234 RepID=A0A2P1PYM6_9GAMM|nr:ATP/GTP-binding protein [Ahniella affigens]AVP99924.1 GTP-binding protein [Ahniella affigens]
MIAQTQHHKILFAGPVGAGKTTAIAAVSDIDVVSTDTAATDDVQSRKANTTVAMDFGTIQVDEKLSIRLVGTPGQVRFSFMWEILAQGAIGLIILIDTARPDPIADLHEYLQHFQFLMGRPEVATAIGLTRMDLGRGPPRQTYVDALSKHDLLLPVVEIDARNREDVREVLLILAAMLESTARGH